MATTEAQSIILRLQAHFNSMQMAYTEISQWCIVLMDTHEKGAIGDQEARETASAIDDMRSLLENMAADPKVIAATASEERTRLRNILVEAYQAIKSGTVGQHPNFQAALASVLEPE